MTTTPTTVSTNPSQNWKWISGILAVTLALVIVGMSVESYFLYRASYRDVAPALPLLAPALPHPNAPALDSIASSLDDWNSPGAPAAAGSSWDELSRLHQQMDQLFNDTLSQVPVDNAALFSAISVPNLDVREEKDRYTVRVDMPGANKESIKVNVEGRLLTISGERTSVNETKDNDKIVRSERSMAQFVRTLQLPGPVKAGAVDAKYDNGVLTLNLPKANQADSSTPVTVH